MAFLQHSDMGDGCGLCDGHARRMRDDGICARPGAASCDASFAIANECIDW